MIATLIFGFMISSLATIYATANKHMFQQYRQNSVKSAASVAMKDIVNNLMAANRIDAPNYNAAGNILAFAVNIDQGYSPNYQGCRISAVADAPTWHYFCLSGNTLYHHTGTISPVPSLCSASTISNPFTPTSYPVASCGGGYGTVTQLSNMVTTVAGIDALFSRKNAHNVYEQDQVKIVLRLYWDPAATLTVGSGLRTSGRVIDTTLIGNVKVNRSVN